MSTKQMNLLLQNCISNLNFSITKTEEYEKCEIFVTMPHHVCTSMDPSQFFPKSVQRVVVNNFELLSGLEQNRLFNILHKKKLPVIWFFFYVNFFFHIHSICHQFHQFIITSRRYSEALKKFIIKHPNVFVAAESFLDQYYLASKTRCETRSIDMYNMSRKFAPLRSKNFFLFLKKGYNFLQSFFRNT